MEFVEISYTLENKQQFWDGEVFVLVLAFSPELSPHCLAVK
jgi:hypothetical protein